MLSLRLEPDLDKRVRRAAALEGSTVSEFLRRAASERAERALSERASERLADVIGIGHGGGGRARDTGATFTRLLDENRRRK